MAFYQYRQNSSGGTFTVRVEDGISVVVVIEAPTARVANVLAEDIGLYFDGSDSGRDCNCCGDRWMAAYESDEVPSYYGTPIDFKSRENHGYMGSFCSENTPIGYVHYLDGRVVEFY